MLRYLSLALLFSASVGFCHAEEIKEVTKEQLRLHVPNYFSWEYTFEPEPGKRIWLRVDDTTYIERYPGGKENKFKILGRITVEKAEGTLAQIEGGKLQVFIPDKDTDPMYLKMRSDETAGWGHMGEMKKIE